MASRSEEEHQEHLLQDNSPSLERDQELERGKESEGVMKDDSEGRGATQTLHSGSESSLFLFLLLPIFFD
jgi:hypothetical protein